MTSQADINGLSVSGRRFSRAYEQPVVQKGMVVGSESSDDVTSEASESGTHDIFNSRMSAVGGLLAKGTLGSFMTIAAVTSLCGKASLEGVSQLFGFMLMLTVTFIVCTGCFYWWGGCTQEKTKLSIRKVLSVFFICLSSDIISRLICLFTAFPPSSHLPANIFYFISLAMFLLVAFSVLIHEDGLNAMFSHESVLFVVCTLILNISTLCLFSSVLPQIILSQIVNVGVLLGLSLSLAGYRFPNISPSRIYWTLSRAGNELINVTPSPSLPRISVANSIDNSQTHSRKVSNSSNMSRYRGQSISSVSSFTSTIPQGYDSEVLSEAHGIITELLLNKDSLPNDTNHKLRKIKDLLAPRFEKMLSHTRVHVGNQIDQDDHDYESDISSSASSLLQANRLSVTQIRGRKNRSASVIQLRRSTTKFATTTTASGMPVLENEPINRERSLALRDVKARISVQEKRFSVHKMGRERSGSDKTNSPLLHVSHSSSAISEPELSETESNMSLQSSSAPHLLQEGVSRQPIATLPPYHSSKRGSQDDGTNLAIIKEGAELQEMRPRSATLPDINSWQIKEEEENSPTDDNKEADESDSDKVFSQGPIGQHKFYSFTRYKRPSVTCDLSEYTSNEHLDMFENIAVWDYPIFELEEKAGDHILSHMAHMLFHEAGLMETFRIPQREFVNYFRALEANYGSNVYHNKTHAADVLHAVSYLMFEIIPEFSHEFSEGDDTKREWIGHARIKETGGNIATAFSILEVLASYMASAMHDFDHPGRTNAFLVGTKSPLSLLYNDRSVLENHHAAASWHLLTNFEENNFLLLLDEPELKRLRFLIIEGILATDLKMHFDILSTFKSKVDPEEGGGIDWNSEMDRMLVMKMIIKMADINTPTKSFDLHRKWTKRITEEFYQQSEEEEKLGLPATIFMDRNHPEKLPAIQLSFIQHLVSPLFQACAEAGIIPGILEETPHLMINSSPAPEDMEQTTHKVEDEASSVSEIPSADDLDDAFAMEREARIESGTKFMSIILTNLQINYDGWKAELPPEETSKEEEEEEGAKKEEEIGDVDEDADSLKVEVKAINDGTNADADYTSSNELNNRASETVT